MTRRPPVHALPREPSRVRPRVPRRLGHRFRAGTLSLLAPLVVWGCGGTRPTPCSATTPCGAAGSCLAGRCESDAGLVALATSRRFVLPATDVAFVQRGSALQPGELPATVTLGCAEEGAAAVLFRFTMPAGVEVLAGFLLVDHERLGASNGEGVGLHAERVVGPWDPRTVTWNEGPELRDGRAPSLVVRRSSPPELRFDVTSLLRPVEGGEPPDHGIALVADHETRDGVELLLVPGLTILPGEGVSELHPAARPPRLELYVK